MSYKIGNAITILIILVFETTFSQVRMLDEFENTDGWTFNISDGVKANLTNEPGKTGQAVRLDYDFTKGTGYGGIQKWFPIDLPENYEFTFWFRADSPSNNFEIKFIDSTGNNVWWVNNRNYDFPEEWTKIRIKKRHIGFAWGPTDDQNLKRIDRIEFTIASFVGGKGSIWIDDLRFEPLPPETNIYPEPTVEVTSSLKGHHPEFMLDASPGTYWKTKGTKDQHILIDFRAKREFGGLKIDWLYESHATSFEILASEDKSTWEKVYSVESNQSQTSFIRLPEAQAQWLKIVLMTCASQEGFGINGITFLSVSQSITPNDFLIYAATNSPPGNYPRYFLEQASFWTITGVNNDVKEGLINADGMVEVDKGLFSIEPVIWMNGEVFTWNNVKLSQSLCQDDEMFSFLPSVTWEMDRLNFSITASSSGEANESSMLDIKYGFENLTDQPLEFELYLLLRPYQVNPYYQWLNLTGGAGKIHVLSLDEERPDQVIRVDDKVVICPAGFQQFSASGFDEGNPVEMIRRIQMPASTSANDKQGMASGMIRNTFGIPPRGSDEYSVHVPFYDRNGMERLFTRGAYGGFDEAEAFWREKTSHVTFHLPPSADRILDAYRSNLVYILINRDHAGIQPGSRSYERSWIRDGSLTSSALLKSGIVEEVKDFIRWYAPYQYENGKVPCVVDFRGPDPVPEHDSHGELIYLIREYFNFTHDTAFLRDNNLHIIMAVNYLESIIAERSTDHYKYGNDSVRAHYGLVPESISHEGYSAKPMHSYWDNFFTMKGLKDAAEIQKILGNEAEYLRIAGIRDTFRENLYNSIELAMRYQGIDYIPGCVELGDFDATSTTIALTPCNELKNLPRPEVYNTFDRYYEFFRARRDGQLEWTNYTPYENRLIGSFILLDQPERAHELIEFFLDDQRPQGFHHWAEVVWKDPATPRFIGDMPHTWVGSDFINAVRSMFVYENEYDQSLVLAAALYQDWIDAPEGMSVENLPTYYGEISYSIRKESDRYIFSIGGDLKMPANGMEIHNFNGSKMPMKVMVNGKETGEFTKNRISVREFPAEVIISY